MVTAQQLLVVFGHTIAIYGFLIVALIFVGRRQFAQLTFVELVVIMILGSAVETSMVAGNTTLLAGLLCAGTLLIFNRLITLLLHRWRWFRRLIIGSPIILIHNGHFVSPHLLRAGLTEADVLQAIRERGFAGPDELRLVVLETDGSIGAVPIDQPIHQSDQSIRQRRAK